MIIKKIKRETIYPNYLSLYLLVVLNQIVFHILEIDFLHKVM